MAIIIIIITTLPWDPWSIHTPSWRNSCDRCAGRAWSCLHSPVKRKYAKCKYAKIKVACSCLQSPMHRNDKQSKRNISYSLSHFYVSWSITPSLTHLPSLSCPSFWLSHIFVQSAIVSSRLGGFFSGSVYLKEDQSISGKSPITISRIGDKKTSSAYSRLRRRRHVWGRLVGKKRWSLIHIEPTNIQHLNRA